MVKAKKISRSSTFPYPVAVCKGVVVDHSDKLAMGKNPKKVAQPEPDIQEEESDEEVALDEDDIEELVLDEDAIPEQKVDIDNTVASLSSPSWFFAHFINL